MALMAIITNSATADKNRRDAITGLLEGKGWHVWHWFEDLWLVDYGDEKVIYEPLRQEIHKAVATPPNSTQYIIFSVSSDAALVGSVNPHAFPWLGKHFTRVTEAK